MERTPFTEIGPGVQHKKNRVPLPCTRNPGEIYKRGNRTTFVVLFLVLFGLGFLSFLLGGQPRGALLPFIGFHDSPRCPVGLVDGYDDAGLVGIEVVPLYKPVSP